MNSTTNRVMKNTGYLYAKMGITMFISLYTTRLILNSLGAVDFGIFNIVGGAIAMLGFLNAAMASATQRFMSYSAGENNKKKQKYIFNISFILHLGIALIAGIALLIAGYFFFNGILNIPADRLSAAKVIYGSLVVSTMFTVMTVPYDAVMNAHENMRYYAVIGIIEALLKLGVAIITVYILSDKLIVYGISMACIPLIVLTVMRIYCHKRYEECTIAPKRYWNKSLMKEMSSFAGWNLLSTASSMICNYAQAIILNNFFGTLLNAAQGIANQINGQLMTLSNNALKAINPVMGKSAGTQNMELLKQLTIESTRLMLLLYSLLAIPLFTYAPYILLLWLKDIPEWTILFVRYQIILSLVDFSYTSLARAVYSYGKIKNMTRWTLVINTLPLIITPILFKYGWQPDTFYIILIITKSILSLNVLYNAQKYCNIPILKFIKETIISLGLFISLITCGLLHIEKFYSCTSFKSFIVSLSLFGICYIIGLFLLLNKTEKKIICALINKLNYAK